MSERARSGRHIVQGCVRIEVSKGGRPGGVLSRGGT